MAQRIQKNTVLRIGQRYKGKVKFFGRRRGWGYIENPADTEDIFAHFKQIEGEGYRNLFEGDIVTFTLAEGKKGKKYAAHNISRRVE